MRLQLCFARGHVTLLIRVLFRWFIQFIDYRIFILNILWIVIPNTLRAMFWMNCIAFHMSAIDFLSLELSSLIKTGRQLIFNELSTLFLHWADDRRQWHYQKSAEALFTVKTLLTAMPKCLTSLESIDSASNVGAQEGDKMLYLGNI